MNIDIEIVEVEPRDGLQNEKTILSTGRQSRSRRPVGGRRRAPDRGGLVRRPRLVPAMADPEAVLAQSIAGPECRRGAGAERAWYERAIDSEVDESVVVYPAILLAPATELRATRD